MANPYHDETGKICSREEMQSALKRLAQAENTKAYFELQSDFDVIDDAQHKEQENVIAGLRKVIDRTQKFNPDSVAFARAVAEVVKGLNDSSEIRAVAEQGINSSFMALELLKNKNTPEDVKELAVGKLSTADRGTLMRNDIDGSYIRFLLKVTPDDPDVITQAIRSFGFSSEESLELARKAPHGMEEYFIHNEWVTTPELEVEAMNLVKDTKYYHLAAHVAMKTTNVDHLKELAGANKGIIQLVLANSSTPAILAKDLLLKEGVLLHDYLFLKKNLLLSRDPLKKDLRKKLRASKPILLKGKAPKSLIDEAKAVKAGLPKTYEFSVGRNSHREEYELQQAIVDSYEDTSESLATLHKRKKRDHARGAVGSEAYSNIADRLQRARTYQQKLGDIQALAE